MEMFTTCTLQTTLTTMINKFTIDLDITLAKITDSEK